MVGVPMVGDVGNVRGVPMGWPVPVVWHGGQLPVAWETGYDYCRAQRPRMGGPILSGPKIDEYLANYESKKRKAHEAQPQVLEKSPSGSRGTLLRSPSKGKEELLEEPNDQRVLQCGQAQQCLLELLRSDCHLTSGEYLTSKGYSTILTV